MEMEDNTTARPSDAAVLADFIESFGASRDTDLWLNLVREELTEVQQAAADFLKEVADLRYVLQGLSNVTPGELREDQKQSVADTLTAIDRIEDIFAGEAGSEVLDEVFARVHASNMSKLGDDGKPILREDGKVLKGPNYKPPYLLDLVQPSASE